MALRLNDLVEAGELFNTRNYSVHGVLKLRGREEPLLLELTGNCSPDLMGRHIRFEAREIPKDRPQLCEPTSEEEAERVRRSLHWRQIGATGDMTAARKVKWADCSVQELLSRSKLKEPPPFEWKPCLYLEWFGQNGRVVVELVDPIIEYLERVDFDGPTATKAPEPETKEDTAGLGITTVRMNQDGDAEVTEEVFPSPDEDDEDGEGPDDPYGLFKPELQQQLDADALSMDRSLKDPDDSDRFMEETERMDDLIENSEGQVLRSFVIPGRRLRSPDELDDAAVEAELKALLAQLALFGIAFDVCEHCTPRDAYRLLVTEVLPKEHGYPEMRGTGWVQHYSTSDYCAQCDAEAERDYQAYEAKRKKEAGDQPPGDAPPDEDKES